MARARSSRVTLRLLPALASLIYVTPGDAGAVTVLLTRRNQSQVHTWDSSNPGASVLLHTTQSNDADYNVAEGSTFGWITEHFGDKFARFIVGNNVGLDAQYMTPYAYPKHITVHNNEIVVMSRNDGTLWRYTPNGVQIGSVKTSSNTGQGMASDGTDLFVSLWNGASSSFARYDPAFAVTNTYNNPTGMGNFNNIVDFVWDAGSGHFFGLATTGEGGTGTESTTVLEFVMGGMVIKSYGLPFAADGIGVYSSAKCGNGKVEGSEACDDGNMVDTDACTNACKLAACGDGIVQAGVEACDDGNMVDTDACTKTCKLAVCGDGIVHDGVEACDDGNMTDGDACTNACAAAVCGDGIIQDGVEPCDDGNDIDDDACSNTCVLASCGDGVVQQGEECDDPNDVMCVDCMIVIDGTTTGATTTTATTTGDATTTDATTTDATTGDATTGDATTAAPTSGGESGGASGTGDASTGDTAPTTAGPADTTTGDGSSSGSGTDGGVDDGGCGCRSQHPGGAGSLALLALLGLASRRRRR
ncbi:DUF4215 domain-containing protein [Nannocystis sp.]|uniref:DUF4215 domain-containing protein n=1 Tax=Nannocystis sp. TaxID=1962667 RepID=UPI0025FB4CA1|nr:DUF4215 domain-containing protein [Nannocystis sp.]